MPLLEIKSTQTVALPVIDRNFWKAIILSIFVCNAVPAKAQFPAFKDGDTVCFVGNSITMSARFYNYLELFYATRFPDRTIEFHNCGISGDVAGGVLNRMQSDILIHKPTWAVLMLGMNDVGRSLYAPTAKEGPEQDKKRSDALDRYYLRCDSIVRVLIEAGTMVVLQTPTIYDQTAKIPMENNVGANDALKKCKNFLELTAKKYDLPIVDYWSPMIKVNKRLQERDPSATIVGSDRVHPGPVGHFLMTCEFLRNQQPSNQVSFCQIDARKNTILKSENCSIDQIQGGKNELSFELLESALPFPNLESDFKLDSLLDFTNELNRQILAVKSLKRGNYVLRIDDQTIGNFSNKELRKGVNLSQYSNTPQNLQAQGVLKLFKQYWELESRMRRLQYVEQRLLNVDPKDDPSDLNEMKRRFAAKMEQVKGGSQSAIDYYNRSFEAYLSDKPMETEMRFQAEQIFHQIAKEKVTYAHKVAITLQS